ncbi:MAG: GNAT family N-acetyltransferase [Chloroflexota bacterium]
MGSKLQSMARTVQDGQAGRLIRQRWSSELVSYGLRRDLSVPFVAPQANFPISLRPISDADLPKILNPDLPGISGETREEIVTRRQMLDAGITACYVAVTAEDVPCYVQWIIGPKLNGLMQSYFHGLYPVLRSDEALLEGAFTPEAFRGQRLMPAAMAQLAEKGAELGARYVITFVTHDNIPSLKGCKRSGFYPHLKRVARWDMFRRRITFTPLPEGTPYPFD